MKLASLKTIGALTLVLALTSTVFAQPNWGSDWKFFRANYIFDKEMFEDQKLKSDYVGAVAIDSEGAVWLGVAGELKVYKDGKITVINKNNYGKPYAVTSLQFDSNGLLWVGTTGGLYRMNKNEEFEYMDSPNMKVITEVAINKDDHVYVAGYTSNAINASPGGLSVFDGSTWKNYSKKNGDFPRKFVEDITFDKKGNVWLSNGKEDSGVAMFNGTEWTFFHQQNSGLTTSRVRAIAFDSKNNAWFGTPKGLIKYDGENWTSYSLKDLIMGSQFSNLTKYLNEPDLLSIAIDKKDVLWIGTEGEGVIRIQDEGRTVINVENSPLTSDYIRKILIDSENRKWFLTGYSAENWTDRMTKDLEASQGSYKGLVMYEDPTYDFFPEWKVLNNFTSELPGNGYYEINKDAEGTMWLASAAYGLVSFSDDKWKTYQSPDRGITGEMLVCVAIGENDLKYGGAQTKGLYQIDGDNLKSLTQDEYGYKKKTFTDLELDNNGDLWISHIVGVDLLKDGKCEYFNKKNGLLSNNIFKIKKDSKGRMWVCTTKGVSIYDNGTWSNYDKKANGLAGYVYDVIEDSEGVFWAGTSKGLYKLEGDQWTLIPPSGKGNVPKYLSIRCLTMDLDGKIWIGSTSNAVFTFDGTDWGYFNYENSGILFGTVYDIEVADNGDLWFSVDKGSSSGVSSSYTNGGSPATAPDPGYELKQEIIKFDPSSSLVIYKKPK